MRAAIPFIPWLLLLSSCGSPPKPPTVDESLKRPANSQMAVELQVCKNDLQNTRIMATESGRLAETLPLPQGAAPGTPSASAAAPVTAIVIPTAALSPTAVSGGVIPGSTPTIEVSGSDQPIGTIAGGGAILFIGVLLAAGIVGAFWLRRRARPSE